ncbi:MAG: hypothetical protein AB3N16_07440 [Flavobacteriaceae bacterium]
MKRMLRGLGVFVLFLVAVTLGLFFYLHKGLPEGEPGSAADELAKKMLTSLHVEAYDNTRFLEWSFRNGKHRYRWDRVEHSANVAWDSYNVNLHLNNLGESTVTEKGQMVSGESRMELIKKAQKLFNNDSFWLVAPFKVFDSGTQRALVPLKNGKKGLLVTYTSGGDTPGDSYLWILNDQGFPVSYQMWVSILPIGGLEATWDNWKQTETGAYLPGTHSLGPLSLPMGTVKGYN